MMMMAPLDLLLEAYCLVVCVAFVVGRIRLVWKWLLMMVLHWVLVMVRCCSLLFLPSFRCLLLLFGFDPAKLCCRRGRVAAKARRTTPPVVDHHYQTKEGEAREDDVEDDAPRR